MKEFFRWLLKQRDPVFWLAVIPGVAVAHLVLWLFGVPPKIILMVQAPLLVIQIVSMGILLTRKPKY